MQEHVLLVLFIDPIHNFKSLTFCIEIATHFAHTFR